jgi:dinuclear metal center YbgI/SA1388 family protein
MMADNCCAGESLGVDLSEIAAYVDGVLGVSKMVDFPGAHNGVQVYREGLVKRIGASVDADLKSVRRAMARHTDLLVVHHGLLWNGAQPFVGERYHLYREMMANNLAVYSVHLPLDAHETLGNNILIARLMKLEVVDRFVAHEGVLIGKVVLWDRPRDELSVLLRDIFPKLSALEYGTKYPLRVGIVSGSVPFSVLQDMRSAKIDTLVTGEIRYSMHAAVQEESLNLYVCGHYETEVFGVRALVRALAEKFALTVVDQED